jgi:hypothetical protein
MLKHPFKVGDKVKFITNVFDGEAHKRSPLIHADIRHFLNRVPSNVKDNIHDTVFVVHLVTEFQKSHDTYLLLKDKPVEWWVGSGALQKYHEDWLEDMPLDLTAKTC